MKKLLIVAAAASAVFVSPAMAQSVPTNTIDIPLTGTLAKKCNVSAFLNGPFDALNLEITTVQGAESVSVNCNYGGSASVTFTSANTGSLKSGSNTVPYKLIVSGSPFSAGVSLATPLVWNGWPASTNTNQTRSLSVSLDNIATVAGTYTDTVTVAVAPN